MPEEFEEHENLTHFDWRCQAVTTLNWDQNVLGIDYQDWTAIALIWQIFLNNKRAIFYLPNMTWVFLDFANKLYNNVNWYFVFANFEKINWIYSPISYENFLNVLQSRIWNIIFSFSALECFINDSIPTEYTYTNAKWRICNKSFIEEKFTMNDKMEKIMKNIFNITNLEENILEKYRKIKYLRDRIVHLKDIDKASSWPEEDTIRKDFLTKDFCNYALEVKDIIGYFIKNSWIKPPRRFSKIPF